ncbi:MAG: permease, partial [Bacillota bacterium]
GLLKNQARLGSMAATACADSACSAGVTGELAPASGGCRCNSATTEDLKRQATLEAGSRGPACGCSAGSDAGVPPTNAKAAALPPGRGLSQIVQKMRLGEVAAVGLPLGLRILAFFLAFSYISHVLTLAFPTQWMLGLFGQGRFHAVPLAATLGVPLYINTEVSMPVIKSFMQMGMGPGAALALTITGAGTCIGAITGAFVIAKSRVVGLVLASLWIGAALAGYIYDLILALA